ncbi:hypothetical protein A6U92_00015 [Agrobacterium rubi]|nr:hypothetical protein A6U92_00015 [Agrobacterium rubi]
MCRLYEWLQPACGKVSISVCVAKCEAKHRQALVISATFMYRLRIELGSHGQMVWSFIIELAQLTQLRQMVRTSLKQEDCHEG